MARYAYGYVDDRKGAAKLNRAYNKIVKQAWTSTRDLVSFGANFAKQIAPYQTGQTWKSIKTSTNPKRDGAAGQIYIEAVPRKDGSFRSEPITTLDLVGIMHRWSGSAKHFHSGDPKFMYTTRDVLNSTGKKQVIASYKALRFK
jgi:hypothetical protein